MNTGCGDAGGVHIGDHVGCAETYVVGTVELELEDRPSTIGALVAEFASFGSASHN
jgi:hypothetical protein